MKGGIDETGNIFKFPCKLVVRRTRSYQVIENWMGDFSTLGITFGYIPTTKKLCHVKSVSSDIKKKTGISAGDYLLNVVIQDNESLIDVEGLDDVTDIFTLEDIKQMIYTGLEEVKLPLFGQLSDDERPTVTLVFGKHYLPEDDCTGI